MFTFTSLHPAAAAAPTETLLHDLPPTSSTMQQLRGRFSYSRRSLSLQSSTAATPRESESTALSTTTTAPPVRRRRQSSLTILFARASANPSCEMIALTREMCQVNSVIAFQRKALIHALLQLNGDYITKVRFICAVDEFATSKDRATRDALGRSICALFAREGMFQITTFHPSTATALSRDRIEHLDQAKLEILRELSMSADFMHALSRI